MTEYKQPAIGSIPHTPVACTTRWRRLALCALSLASLVAATANAAPPVTNPTGKAIAPDPLDDAAFTVLSTRTLDADGAASGRNAYELIRNFGGRRSIEAPDLYAINHPGLEHIYEDTDPQIGNHFVFIIHRDLDMDRDRLKNDDRQRNEIKSYDKSEDALKGFENETLLYTWRFKINASMEVSTRFSHFFQLKAVGGADSQPMLTISGAERRGEDGIEVRYSPGSGGKLLARQPWRLVTDEWIEVYCRATFAEEGEVRLIATRMRDGANLFDITAPGLDLWRGEASKHFVRPKWGIYRSLADRDNLRPDEESVRFANFSVSKIRLSRDGSD